MKKLKLFALTAVALMGVSGVANAETAMLASDDFVGISFWLVSMALLASTAFFFIERASVPAGWRVSITVAGLVTGIAFIHYMYMRDVWIMTGESPTVYRYIDWLITVPLLMLEFYFVLAAVGKANSGVFWRLMIGTLVMLVGGYLGEAGYINATLGFVIGMAGWFYILYEVFSGEAGNVAASWRTSIIVSGLVTGIAFVHYVYMRDVWVMTGESPTVYRYIDWLITVPLLMIEFYLVLAAVGKANSGIFWRLLIGTVVMLVGGYLGEAGYINATLGFVIGMAGWFYILYEVFSGEAGKAAAKSGNKALVTAFGAMRMIVTVGWAIYPLGYVFGYLTGGVDADSLNVIYNIADLLNKTAFGLIIWAAAVQSGGRKAK